MKVIKTDFRITTSYNFNCLSRAPLMKVIKTGVTTSILYVALFE